MFKKIIFFKKSLLLIMVVVLFLMLIGKISALIFDNPSTIQITEGVPAGVAAGEFNGDSNIDLAVLYNAGNFSAGNIKVLTGNGNGTFTSGAIKSINQTNSTSIAAGDFNKDNKLDVATTNYITNNISVLLGTGTGAFDNPWNYGSNIKYPLSIRAADFNNDSLPDLVIANGSSTVPTLAVLRGQGNGTFSAMSNLNAGGGGKSVEVADFNSDAKMDIAVSVRDDSVPISNLSIFLGNGNGTFQPIKTYNTSSPGALTAADYNGDLNIDLAVANANTSRVSIFKGNGDGTFQEGAPNTSLVSISSLVSGDFNKDSKIDIATLSTTSTLTILVGNGDGTFPSRQSYSVGSSAIGLASADFNNDLGLDLVSSNASGSSTGTLSVLLNTLPSVITTNPLNNASNIPVNSNITAVFSEAMNPATINNTSFTVSGNVGGTVSYDAGTRTATFDPTANLAYNTTYTATITTAVQDTQGNSLPVPKVWSFTTEPPNQKPTASIVSISPNPATPGQNIVFLGSGTDTDGTITAYEWSSSKDGVLSTLATFSRSNLSVGTHTISFRVRDDDGEWSAPDTETLINDVIPNQKPTAIINSITPNPATQGENITFSGSGTDDGTITAYSWRSSIDGPLSNSAIFSKNNLSVGTHTIFFKVQDNDGVWSEEVPFQLTIVSSSTGNQDPGGQNPGNQNPGGQNPGGGGPQQQIQNTLLSLSAKPKAVQAGKATTIKGQLKDSSGKGVSGRKVVLKQKVLQKIKKKVKGKIKTINKWIWKAIANLTTDSKGNFSKKLKPKITSIYKASYAGEGSYKAANSEAVKITVKKPKKKKK